LVTPTGTKGSFCPVGATKRDKRVGPFVPGGATNQDKMGTFCPGWYLQPGQKAPIPPLARLAFGPGTKATYCLGPKGNRDKWPGTKAYSVVVRPSMPSTTWHWMGMARWPRCTENKPNYNCIDKVSGTKYVLSTEYGPIHIFFGSIVPVICTVYSCLLPTFNRRSHK